MDHGHYGDVAGALEAETGLEFISSPPFISVCAGLKSFKIEAAQALVIGKFSPGLSKHWVDQARQMLGAAAAGELGPLKFIVFDLEVSGEGDESRADEATQLLGEIANLILHAPIITIAYARKAISGGDLELALACSMLISGEDARFSFAADPVEAVATYALLAQKLGFVRAERLMEREEVLTAAQMLDLFLLKEITPVEDGLAQFLARAGRRHNSAAAMYRAQRIATPLIAELFGDQRH